MNMRMLMMLMLVIAVPVAAAGIFWLATPPAMPPVQKMEQSIPDDRIPR